jgi:hypothetical protein
VKYKRRFDAAARCSPALGRLLTTDNTDLHGCGGKD